jgi:hypothetical protein
LHIFPIWSIYLQSFMLISLIVLELCPCQSSKSKNEQRAITPTLGKIKLWFFALHISQIWSTYLQSSMSISLIVSELCHGQCSNCKNEQRSVTQKLGNAELRFLSTAHLPNEIYLPTNFMFLFQRYVCSDKKSRRTDRQNGDYMLIIWGA